ncbi:MAG: NADH-quinone oxidoreductase subunit NuoH [Acidobacteriota bacterium]
MSGLNLLDLLVMILKIGVVLTLMALSVPLMILMERKIIGFMQSRIGPKRVGPSGVLQTIADGIKLLLKEDIIPSKADRWVFRLAPLIMLVPALAAFSVIPFSGTTTEILGRPLTPWITDINIGLLFIISISSVGVFGVVLGGWASNSKYPLLGALRSAAQMVSYEVPLGLALVAGLMWAGTASMVGIVEAQRQAGVWFFVPQIVGTVIYFIAGVAETNRAPFDLPEAETELVSGFHTEYSGMRFGLFFIAEYANMVVVSAVATTLFFGGWLRPFPGVAWMAFLDVFNLVLPGAWGPFVSGIMWFSLKVSAFIFIYYWIRATFPRYRYDQLMTVGWKWLLPIALVNILATGGLILWLRPMVA